ncbi:MAG: class I SAM-dependent methyltransferase [Balneolaceae bacterium]|nr:class I SAM-dependent methyltransferase [Balneolaceae bacterium]
MPPSNTQPEYSKLAEIYDGIMEDVDYEVWADFIDDIIQVHHSRTTSILELACGTGSLALSLDELECYEILGTDKSPAMIAQAKKKASEIGSSVRFEQMDFLEINLDRKFDVAVSIFDSINYLHRSKDVQVLLKQVEDVLNSNGLFIFDFTTPKNSVKAIQYLNNEEGYTSDNYRFFRKSSYNPSKQIHYNNFKIEKLDRDQETVLKSYTENHSQRIYTLKEMLDIIDSSNFKILAKYEGFDFIDASEESLRITMVLTCPTTMS